MKTRKRIKTTTAANVATAIKAAKLTGCVKDAIIELYCTGITRTGKSGYSGGWSSKSIWTSGTLIAAKQLGLTVISGNDAPRGGAAGEYVQLVADKRLNRSANKLITIVNRAKSIKQVRTRKLLDMEVVKQNTYRAEVVAEIELILPVIANFENDLKSANKEVGINKSAAQQKVMQNILAAAGVDKLNHFWNVFKIVNNYDFANETYKLNF